MSSKRVLRASKWGWRERIRGARAKFPPGRIERNFFYKPYAVMRSDFRQDEKFRRCNKKQNTVTGGSAFFVLIPFVETKPTDFVAKPASIMELK